MFMHGGWLHLIGNMVFLWVFGDNVEDAMGHVRYAVFYLIGGFAATAAHTFVSQGDLIPAIGASGAISAVLGAYIVLYPRASVTAIIPIFFFIPFQVSALFLIGLWFVMQLFNGIIGLTEAVGAGGGVAWFAHIGGFVAGVLLVKVFVLGRRVPQVPRAGVRDGRGRDWDWSSSRLLPAFRMRLLYSIGAKECSSAGRAAVSKTAGRGFESLHSCHRITPRWWNR